MSRIRGTSSKDKKLTGNSGARGNPGEDKAIGGEHWQS